MLWRRTALGLRCQGKAALAAAPHGRLSLHRRGQRAPLPQKASYQRRVGRRGGFATAAAKRCIKPQRLHVGVDAEGEGQEHSRTVILARAKGSLAPREDQRLVGHAATAVTIREVWGH
jgi:hypothetical protein